MQSSSSSSSIREIPCNKQGTSWWMKWRSSMELAIHRTSGCRLLRRFSGCRSTGSMPSLWSEYRVLYPGTKSGMNSNFGHQNFSAENEQDINVTRTFPLRIVTSFKKAWHVRQSLNIYKLHTIIFILCPLLYILFFSVLIVVFFFFIKHNALK